jgi:hypothetical protein
MLHILYIMSVVFGWADPRSRYESEVKEFIKKCKNEELKEKFKLFIKVQSLLYDTHGRGIGDRYAYDDASDFIGVAEHNEEVLLAIVNKKLKQCLQKLKDVNGYDYMSNEKDNELLSKRKQKAIKLEKSILEMNVKYPALAPAPAPAPMPVPMPVPNNKSYSSFFKPASTPIPQKKTRIPDSDDEFETDEFEDAGGGGSVRKTSKGGFIKKRKFTKTIKKRNRK